MNFHVSVKPPLRDLLSELSPNIQVSLRTRSTTLKIAKATEHPKLAGGFFIPTGSGITGSRSISGICNPNLAVHPWRGYRGVAASHPYPDAIINTVLPIIVQIPYNSIANRSDIEFEFKRNIPIAPPPVLV
jgi:hypothetical protein